jgi:hypothetical protein
MQPYRPVELVVVDDGSTDETEKIVRDWIDRYGQSRQFDARYLYQSNQGAPAARNKGMEAATGDYLLFLDSDDQLTDEALTSLVRAQEESKADVVYGNFRWVYEDERDPTFQSQAPPSERTVVSVLQNCPRTSTALVSSEAVGRNRWREDLPCAQEFGYFMDLALDGAGFLHIGTTVLRGLHHHDDARIKNNHTDGITMGQTIGRYLLDVETDLRAHGKKESAACDRALLYFSGLLASKGERRLATRLLARANRWRFVGRMCSELSIPGRFPFLASLIGIRGTEIAFRTKHVLQDAFR